MIALAREKPKDCFWCPCFETLVLNVPMNDSIQHLFRRCRAQGKLIINPITYKKGEPAPQEWVFFPKPEWCPWIEV